MVVFALPDARRVLVADGGEVPHVVSVLPVQQVTLVTISNKLKLTLQGPVL